MKFANTLLALPALALAAAVPADLPETNATCTLDIGFLDLDVSSPQIDVLSTLRDLVEQGEIEIGGAADAFDGIELSKRSDVPFLHCGYSRATRCAISSGGVLATCFWAAISGGRDIKEDSKCVAAAAAFGSNLPNDCKLCLGIA